MARAPGLSVRLRLTLSYAGFLMLAGALLLGAVWLFLLRYVPDRAMLINADQSDFNGVFPIRSGLLHVFAPRAAAVMAFLLVFGLVGGWILAGRMLAPLTRLTDATRLAAAGSLAHRIALPGRRDEFRELADAFDTMLARLEAHVAAQRRFAANASHELRTPLAITQTLLDVARAEDAARAEGAATAGDASAGAGLADRDLLDRLHAVNARAIDLTEALLVLSRADQRSFEREPVDLSLLVEEAAETLLPLAEDRGLRIEGASGAPAPTTGSRALLLQLTTNLVHNAIVHNRADGGTVWVTTTGTGDAVVLTVENTGEPLEADLVTTLAEPFRRGTERTSAQHAGVGLGLALVRSIAEAHDGSLALAPRSGGGLRATVRLPAAHRPLRHDDGLTAAPSARARPA